MAAGAEKDSRGRPPLSPAAPAPGPSTGEIVSFHPAVPADRFIWERRRIDRRLADVLRRAGAVILPPTVDAELYWFCRSVCPRVFPNYDVRFHGQGKTGDTLLFWAMDVPHPATTVYPRVESLVGDHPEMGSTPTILSLPVVIKGAHGGEGSQTWLVRDETGLQEALARLRRLEWQGVFGFVVQEYIPDLDRDLRVVVIGDHVEAYWRIREEGFHNNLARGGRIERRADPERLAAGIAAVRDLCRRTGINLAGFDLVFRPGEGVPLFLEINYTFSARGVGEERYAALLRRAVDHWLHQEGPAPNSPSPPAGMQD